MNKRYKITINRLFITVAVVFVVFSSITHSAKNRAPVVSNVHAEQRPGTEQAVITYDVDDADGDTLTISVQISDDDGAVDGNSHNLFRPLAFLSVWLLLS